MKSTAGTLTIDPSTINNAGTLEANGGGIDLTGDTITNTNGTIKFDATSTGTVSGTTITGGTVTNNGTLNLTGGDTIENGALGNTGQINVSGTDALNGETITNTGTLEVLAAGALTLTDDLISGTGKIIVDLGATLILTDTNISGAELINEGGTIKVFGTTTIDTIQSLLIGQTIVESGQVLNLQNELVLGSLTVLGASGSSAAGILNLNGNDAIDSNTIYNGTVYNGPLTNAGQINVSGTNNIIENSDGTAPGGTNIFTNTGTLEVLAVGALTLGNDQVTNTNGTIKFDATSTGTVSGTTISGGILSDAGTVEFHRYQLDRRCRHHRHQPRHPQIDHRHADHRSQHDQQCRAAGGQRRRA